MDLENQFIFASTQTNCSIDNTINHVYAPLLSPLPVENITANMNDISNDKLNKHPWQVVKIKNKRKRSKQTTSSSSDSANNQIKTTNRFAPLATANADECQDTEMTNCHNQTERKPPAVTVYGVTNYSQMLNDIKQIVSLSSVSCKSLSDNRVQIKANDSDSYRSLVKFFRDEGIEHHTYQIKSERSFRVVIRHLHHSIDINMIKSANEDLGHKVRNISNVKHRLSKLPLSLFFVDLEPRENNAEIYKTQVLLQMKIKVEAPRKKNIIPQCFRCQAYGHTKNYCCRAYVCVKCGGNHNTNQCSKKREEPPVCANCQGNHPSNYKGCETYKKLQQARDNTPLKISGNNTTINNQTLPSYWPTLGHQAQAVDFNHARQNQTYSEALQLNTTSNPPNIDTNSTQISDILQTFMVEIKNLLKDIMNQQFQLFNGVIETIMSKLTNNK